MKARASDVLDLLHAEFERDTAINEKESRETPQTKVGQLLKRSKKSRRWKAIDCTLQQGRLVLHKRGKNVTIVLNSETRVAPVPKDKYGREGVFKIETGSEKIVLQANATEAQQWVRALQESAIFGTSKRPRLGDSKVQEKYERLCAAMEGSVIDLEEEDQQIATFSSMNAAVLDARADYFDSTQLHINLTAGADTLTCSSVLPQLQQAVCATSDALTSRIHTMSFSNLSSRECARTDGEITALHAFLDYQNQAQCCVGKSDGTLAFCDLQTGNFTPVDMGSDDLFRFDGAPLPGTWVSKQRVWDVSGNTGGRHVAACVRGNVVLCDVQQQRVWWRNPVSSADVLCLAWGSTTTLATAGNSQVVKVLDVRTRKATFSALAHGAPVRKVAWSPAESYLLASAGDDMDICIWDVRAGGEKALLQRVAAHSAPVTALAFAPSHSDLLVSGAQDRTFRWINWREDLAPRHIVASVSTTWPVVGVDFCDDFGVCAAAADGTLHLQRVRPELVDAMAPRVPPSDQATDDHAEQQVVSAQYRRDIAAAVLAATRCCENWWKRLLLQDSEELQCRSERVLALLQTSLDDFWRLLSDDADFDLEVPHSTMARLAAANFRIRLRRHLLLENVQGVLEELDHARLLLQKTPLRATQHTVARELPEYGRDRVRNTHHALLLLDKSKGASRPGTPPNALVFGERSPQRRHVVKEEDVLLIHSVDELLCTRQLCRALRFLSSAVSSQTAVEASTFAADFGRALRSLGAFGEFAPLAKEVLCPTVFETVDPPRDDERTEEALRRPPRVLPEIMLLARTREILAQNQVDRHEKLCRLLLSNGDADDAIAIFDLQGHDLFLPSVYLSRELCHTLAEALTKTRRHAVCLAVLCRWIGQLEDKDEYRNQLQQRVSQACTALTSLVRRELSLASSLSDPTEQSQALIVAVYCICVSARFLSSDTANIVVDTVRQLSQQACHCLHTHPALPRKDDQAVLRALRDCSTRLVQPTAPPVLRELLVLLNGRL